jgi:hypothetical protein
MERRGLPTLTIVTERFEALGRAVAESLERDDLPLLVIDHPFGGLPEGDVRARAQEVAARLPDALRAASHRRADEPEQPRAAEVRPHELELEAADAQELSWELHRLGLTDGLPVVAPTAERVESMLACIDREPDFELGPIPPVWKRMPLSAAAANAVMAGCRPAALAVVVQALEAMLALPAFNLYGMQTTTHPIGPMLLVCGPMADELGVWGGAGCLGPGFLANASIGRALRLLLMNGGEARPGELDKATLGQPGKYSFCFSENETESPWPPYRADLGHAHASTITVAGAEAPTNINDHGSTSAEGILRTIAATIATAGNNNLYWLGDPFLVLGPEHANTLAREGLSKQDVQRELHERARVPVERMSAEQFEHVRSWIHEDEIADFVDASGALALTRRPEDLNIVVAGGPGKHSMWIPTWFRSATVPISDASGKPIESLAELQRASANRREG